MAPSARPKRTPLPLPRQDEAFAASRSRAVGLLGSLTRGSDIVHRHLADVADKAPCATLVAVLIANAKVVGAWKTGKEWHQTHCTQPHWNGADGAPSPALLHGMLDVHDNRAGPEFLASGPLGTTKGAGCEQLHLALTPHDRSGVGPGADRLAIVVESDGGIVLGDCNTMGVTRGLTALVSAKAHRPACLHRVRWVQWRTGRAVKDGRPGGGGGSCML